jgi:hypothetical protein
MQATPNTFWEWTVSLSPGERFSLLVIVLAALVALISVVAGTLYYAHKNRLENSLKRELLDRGMTADEIATVMKNPKDG